MSDVEGITVVEVDAENLADAIFRGRRNVLRPAECAIAAIQEAFQEWIKDGSEGLNKEQTKNAMFESGQNPTDDEIEEYWQEKGKTDDDIITEEEFKELYDRLGDPKAAIKEALMHFDRNQNGKVDRQELREILRATGALENVATPDSYVDLVLNLGDKNDDNELDIEELVTMIQDGLIRFKKNDKDDDEGEEENEENYEENCDEENCDEEFLE